MKNKLLSQVALGLLLSMGAANADDFPEFNTPAWRELFAIDVAAERLNPVPVAAPVEATTYSITYKGEIAGFDVGRIFLNAEISPSGYALDYRMEQKGVARWFSDAEAKADARGTLTQGSIASHYYFNHDYEREDDQQYIELYRPAGDPRMHLWTAPQYTFHQSVTEEQTQGAVDPMGALMQLGFLPQSTGKTPCDRVAAVFDGRRRFNLEMRDDGEVWIRKGGKSRYEGAAFKCKLEQIKVAGYREKDRGDIEGDLWVYLAEVPEEFRTESFAYIPVMILAKQGILGARLEGKSPIITAPDGRQINLGNLPRQKKPKRFRRRRR